VAYPSVDWILFADNFVKRLGLQREQFTTQIGHYDSIAALCDNMKRINTILTDFCRDVWQYISMDYFKQAINPKETGSSAMPHKGNILSLRPIVQ
jgi:adenylosuccinate lyase